MALDAEDFDFQGLGDKLTQTILGSFNEASKKLNLSSVGTSLVDALKNVKMSKVIEDSLTKSSEVKATMKDIQKKLEDGFNKIKFKVGDIVVPDLPEQVVKVAADTSAFKLPKLKQIDIPVTYKVDKLNLPKTPELQVPVTYEYSKLTLPKAEAVDVPVEFEYDTFKLPTFKAIQVGVKYAYEKLILPKVNKLQVAVKYVYDKVILPKVESLKVGVQFIYEKLVLPTAQKVSVAVEYVYDKLIPPKAQELPITLIPDTTKLDSVKPTVDTGPFEKVGDLVREFVNLTQEANKKTKVTSELYSKIVSIAEKLVATKRMEKGAIDQILASYQQKMDIPTAEITAEVVDVDTSKVAEASTAPIEVEANVSKVGGGDFSNIEKAMTVLIGKLGKQLQSLFKTFDNKKLNIAIPPTDRLDDYRVSYDTISSAVEELKSEVGELSNLELFLSVYSKDTYDIVQKRIAVENLLVGKKREELDVAAQVIGLANTASLSESQLKALIESKLVSLHKEVELRGLIVNATESYNSAIQQSDLGKLTAELTSQLSLIEDEVAAKATVLALENERVTGVRALTAEQVILLKSEDSILNKKKEILNADQALLNLNKTIVESNKKIDLTIQTQQLANQLSLLSEEAKMKAELLLQQKLVNGEVVELTNAEKLSIVFLDQQVASSKKFADALVKVGQGQTEINNLVEDLGYEKVVAELTIQKGLTESTIIAQAKSLIAAKVAAGEAAKLTDEEMSQLQVLNDQIKSDQQILGLKQRIVEATNSLSKTMQDATAEALALESPMYTQLGLTQDLTREKALAVILDGQRRGLTTDEINASLQLLKNEDGILQKTRERVNASKDLEAAADAYAQAVRQANADLQIKSLIVALHLTEDEVIQESRLLALKNEQLAAAGQLTKQELDQIAVNNGLTNLQVAQLKLNNQTLRHRREEVELIEHVANYQKEINEEVHHLTASWKKLGATIKAIYTDPTLAKGVIAASVIKGVHDLTHSMHEFKEVGMDAGNAVAATFKSFSIASVLGLSKSREVTATLASEFGNLNALTDAQVDAVGRMAAANGLAGDEATNMTMAISRMPGMTRETASNSEQVFKNIGKIKGVIPGQIMKEVAKNTQFMAIYSKGGFEGFAKAAAHAKKMGVNLGDMLSAARKTLDFESSLNAQMEASVMLGKEINLDKLRQATLSGDANAILEEQQNLIRQAGGLDKMNVLQKEKLAEAMGMTVEQMQKMNDEAQFQNEYFGEQAGLMANITGYALKYGEAFGKAVTMFGPLISAVASLVLQNRMLNAIKMQNTGIEGANAGATLSSAAAKNADTLSTSTNTTASRLNNIQQQAYKAARLSGIPATQAMTIARNMDTTSTVSNTGVTASNTLAKAQGRLATLASTVATKASALAESAWNTTKTLGMGLLRASGVLWIADKAYKMGSAIATGVLRGAELATNAVIGAGIALRNSAFVVTARDTLAKYANAAATGAVTVATGIYNALQGTVIGRWIISKAMLVAETLAKWANVGATAAQSAQNTILAGSQRLVGTTGATSAGGLAAFGAGLKGLAAGASAIPVLLAIGAAVLLVGGGVYLAATGMANLVQSFSGLTGPQIVGAVAALLMLNIAIVTIVGTMALLAFSGVGGAAALLLLALGAAFLMIGAGVALAATGLATFANSVKDISGLGGKLMEVSKAILSISESLNKFSIAGLRALPALGVVAAMSKLNFGGVAAPTPAGIAGSPTPGPVTSVAPAPGAIPTAQAGAPAAATTTTTATTTKTESSGDMKALLAKLDGLIAVLQAGGTITMDGQKVANIVQRNIRAVRFSD